jgi:hypothetical protein
MDSIPIREKVEENHPCHLSMTNEDKILVILRIVAGDTYWYQV